MKKGSTWFLKAVLILLACVGIGLCIGAVSPIFEGKGAGEVHPFLWLLCVTIIPYLFALVQAWKLLQYIDQNIAFSQVSVKALQNIKYCGISITVLFLANFPFIFKIADEDDAPGGILIWLAICAAPMAVAVFAAVLQKLIQSAIDLKTENDLTV